MNGTIKFFKKERGYGFILSDGMDIFFHIFDFSDKKDYENLKIGDLVKFEEGQSRGKKKAIEIKLVGKDEENK